MRSSTSLAGVDVAVVALQETGGGFQRRFPIPGAHLHLGLLRDSRRERRVRDRHLVERVQRVWVLISELQNEQFTQVRACARHLARAADHPGPPALEAGVWW